jgi:rare lipoprotein A (peptidoglycan hydrolase)
MAGNSLIKLVVASSLVASTVALPIAALAQSGVASVYSGQKTANGEYASAGG